LFAFLIFCYTFNSVSTKVSAYTLSNPAFTAHSGDFEFYLEHKDIGEIEYFNLSAQLRNWGLGFSSGFNEYSSNIEKRNWLSLAHHLNIPLSLGFNLGMNKIWNNTNVLCDIGLWFRHNLSVGIGYCNIFNDDRLVRFGTSYTWRQITGTIELEDSIRNNHLTPHFLIGITQPVGDIKLILEGGYHPERLVGGMGIKFREFIEAVFFYEETVKLMIGVNFSPPVRLREVTIVETLLVEQPIVIKKTIIKKEPKHTKPKTLSKKDKSYCENHYLKGIDYYVNNQLEKAIKEWNLVISICPEYKDVKRYLENAREKLKLLKEE
jgi:hypothetical protein